MRKAFEDNSEIAEAYNLYVMCRTQQLFSVEVSKNNKTVVKIVRWTTGLHSLPEEGGMLDQPHRLMHFFDQFMIGDANATFRELNS